MAKSSKGASSKPKELSKKATKELAQTKARSAMRVCHSPWCVHYFDFQRRLTFQIVVRRLPPALTEEEFFEQLGYELPYDYFYFSSSDPRYVVKFSFCVKFKQNVLPN